VITEGFEVLLFFIIFSYFRAIVDQNFCYFYIHFCMKRLLEAFMCAP